MPLPATMISVNDTTVWDAEDYGFLLPFSFQWNKGINTNAMVLALGFPGILPDSNYRNAPYASGFSAGAFGDLIDKGLPMGFSESPIRTQITGTAPNRIYKLEIRNAGFYDEYDASGSFTDSTSFQYWLYEGSNVLEMRYGPSSVQNLGIYYPYGGPTVL